MRWVAAFLKLVRLPNLFFIALTQFLFQFCIYQPLFRDLIPGGDMRQFILIVLASLLIGAAGYIINDYFDLNIDEVNKPDRMVIGKIISRRWAIAWHFILSAAGLILTFLAFPFLEKWYLILINAFTIALLWFYSASFKRKLLIGNVVISLLTAWVILVLFYSKIPLAHAFGSGNATEHKFFRITFLYAGFAFISSLIREAVKDMEDREGDEKHGCRTMPIAWGANAVKIYVAVLLAALIIILVIIQIYVLQFRWWWPVLYSVALIIIPLVYILLKLFRANSAPEFHLLSNRIKLAMLTGVLSMIYFYFYL
ncbi:MAG: geranylgeranylglycerol-phosphate geranylgeranyltransferase [Chitinophagaceae bacterium]|nr:geranylgeranylglycerol-phosphate geranylgeranyltransferase [Chitinophagaceae bacterium]